MEVTLLGTGAPEGLPGPGCPCAACAVARGEDARGATAVLVDGTLLLDLTPGLPFTAARTGHSLGGVRQVLLSHPHDGPAVELPAGLPPPGRVPDGRELALLTGHRVRAVPTDTPGTGYEVLGPDGARLLYLPPGAAPADVPERSERPEDPEGSGRPRSPGRPEGSGRPGDSWRLDRSARPPRTEQYDEQYDMVLLDAVRRPDAVARLRATGGVGAATDVLAVHIGHDVPPGAELRRQLAAAGARALPDGTRVGAGTYGSGDGGTGQGAPGAPGVAALPNLPDVPAVPRRTLVLGGARSGKSVEAERRLATFPDVLYVATGGSRPGDPEWAARVSAHRERRPGSWRTVETCDLVPLLAGEGPRLLIDCLSLWLSTMMDEVGAWDDDEWHGGGERELRRRVATLVDALRHTPRSVVAVSNEVGSGVVPATASGRRYRDELGRLNAACAAECEHVLLVVAGQALVLRG